jgi:ASC-1-like (ASCH) protein
MEEIGVESSILADIISGKKTIEGRLGKPRFIRLRVGDVIAIREDIWEGDHITKSISDRARVVITQLLYFESFEEMLHAIDYTRALPSAISTYDAVLIYRKFFTIADEKEYGVIAITFCLVQ